MLQEYLPLLIIFLIALLVGIIAMLLGYLFGPKRPTRRKSAPYESGMVPYGPGRRRMSVRFYLIAVLFILFDIEVIFVISWATVVRQVGVPGLIAMAIFLGLLEVAHLYAWKKGALEWE
ncbi:MAG TPA: NADH-quinone oxidoreductase subunit A [Chloroflexi bacterium]|jgi:NADH-quinone oxidoreductase subunit A|nr:NADH-quinone oxidoreductase subunit A [Chloroflexota bacterium]